MTAPATFGATVAQGHSFAADVAKFADLVQAREQRVFEEVVNSAFASVVDGSAATGAPGQPLSTRQSPPWGHLKDSWAIRWAAHAAHVFTRHPGAPTIELGTRLGKSLVLHVGNGGFHSLQLTRAAFTRLVALAVAQFGELGDADPSEGL
jgi:hypothetical protein